MWNIPPNEPIAENNVSGIKGHNGFGKTGYGGRCPPAGPHLYYFKVFELNAELDLQSGSDKKELFGLMEDHIPASDKLMVHYRRKGK